ncbi:MAG: hypothetical protein M0R17_08225 [Candidatus Omnitrophica bacterium]|jgi:hypothetical protein|nr:hypothetical protein [Candidatus Omnitrophota bacterium]
MKVGTKSLLFGAHQFILHPIFVFIAWWKLYGFPKDPRLWVAFIVHDWGYWGKPNMDGKEGETHVELGARIMSRLFDDKGIIISKEKYQTTRYYKSLNTFNYWYNFNLYHSRFYAKNNNQPISKLCVADKYAFCIPPKWLYMLLVNMSGEIYEYMDISRQRSGKPPIKDKDIWYDHVYKYMVDWVKENKDKVL